MAKEDVNKKIDALGKELKKITASKKSSNISTVSDLEDELNDVQELVGLYKGINASKKEQAKLEEDISDYLKLQEDFAGKLNKEAEEENALRARALSLELDMSKKLEKNYRLKIEEIKNKKKLTKEQKKSLELQKKYNEYIKESLGFVDSLASSIEEIPLVGGMLSKYFDTEGLKDELTEIATKQLADVKAGVTGVGTGFKNVAKVAGKLLLPILAIVTAVKLIEDAIDLDKETTSLARNLGISKDEAFELHHQMRQIQRDTDNVLMTVENQTAAMQELVTATGGFNSVSEDMIANQVLLTKNLGVSSESASKLNMLFKAQGDNLEDNTATIASTVEMYNKATGANISTKATLEDIAGVSKKIQMQYKGNVKALTLQVLKAKQLGLSLDKIAEIGRQSLNIDQSIQDEMEARVLTGKNINLNEFRAAALRKDQAGMMAEIQKYAGSSAEFASMNSIAAESMAKAFGMSTDEFADMLAQQELYASLGNKTLEQANEQDILNSNLSEEKKKQLLSQKKTADVTEKMAKLTEGLKDAFVDMTSSVMPMIVAFSDFLNKIMPALTVAVKVAFYPLTLALGIVSEIVNQFTNLKDLMTGGGKELSAMQKTLAVISGVVAAIAGAQLLWNGYKAVSLMLSKQELALSMETVGVYIGKAIAAIYSTFAAIPFGLGIPLAIAAAAGVTGLVYGAIHKKQDDGAMSPVGPSGYSRVLSGPEGSIAINDDDSIVTGTDLKQGSSGNMGNAEVVGLLKQLIAKIDQPVQIKIGGKVIDEIGTQTSLKRTYTANVDRGYGAFG